MKEIVLFENINKCCGCGACMNVCPKQAIYMQSNQEGFIYPVIDETKCIGCLKCKKVCAFQKGIYTESLKETYVAVAKNADVLESASGGLFASFAKSILDVGGLVYGCAMLYKEGKLYPKHICVSRAEDLILLKGSKYVQSDLGYIYQDVQDKLKKGNTVLFSGTPCQIAGLHGFLQKNYANLYTVDIICHGVPSVQLFQDYLTYTEQKLRKKIVEFRFRDKSKGWKLFGQMNCENMDGSLEQYYFEPEESSYYQMFLNSYTYRENCYSCPYACDNRQGDITIGDYWCIELVHPELVIENDGLLDSEKGVSCLIINNSQGREMFERFGSGILYFDSTYEKAAKYNAQLNRPSELKPERKKVFIIYAKGYANLEKWYQHRLLFVKLKRVVIRMIPKFVKRIIKSILHRI